MSVAVRMSLQGRSTSLISTITVRETLLRMQKHAQPLRRTCLLFATSQSHNAPATVIFSWFCEILHAESETATLFVYQDACTDSSSLRNSHLPPYVFRKRNA